jgi:NifU-like protein involved in Fe-S cluster formation/Pyruvate/2-oxoacid:ferredoxin oxidoreductase delta subunit
VAEELTIISGKGGTGKTSVTASFAVLADRPVIADCDVDAADLHLVLSPRVVERHEFRSGNVAVIRREVCTGCGACLGNCRFDAMAPRNYGSMEDSQGNARITGPCGDTMEFWIRVLDGKVERISFITTGCGPSMASGSMTTLAEGKSIEDAAALQQKDVLDALQGRPSESEHCALLAVNTLRLRTACED